MPVRPPFPSPTFVICPHPSLLIEASRLCKAFSYLLEIYRVEEYMPAELKLYEFFRLNGWNSPVSATNNPYTFTHRTEGKSMWEYMAQFPERLKNFNYTMVAQNNATFWTVSLFPFYEELSKYETTDGTPLVVDVGGGKGHVSRQIRQLCKDLKGRVILQDRREALSDVIDGLENVELMEYDFFTPQPVKGMSYSNCHL